MSAVTCSRCGTIEEAPEGGVPVGWSLGTSAAGVEWLCLPCTRMNIRAIEAKLSEEWWE